ncbi:hypothetical protein UFOVP1549_13 [uncultured Caudovirales phage]|uniref:Uncharacterized protein n=1 Tax=uncultured Caudovirales phage TaxID=2100421 RepID=A0A6J7XC20_9CAUD|nr:hypothetical protein UFOVP303_20 [uncultured Caudovirales phage]CAB5228497.1 hypothetical protein UFOVP1549_13 [uncultured Caudovirales phage]
MPQYYRILDNGVPAPKKVRGKKKDDTWSNPDSAMKMMKKYSGDSSDLKNVRNVMGKMGINNVFDQLNYMAEKDVNATVNSYRKKQQKKNTKRGVK